MKVSFKMKEKLYIPLGPEMITEDTIEMYLDILSKFEVEMIFLATDRRIILGDADEIREYAEVVKNASSILERAGYKVGVWISSLGFGGEVPPKYRKKAKKYTRIRPITGNEVSDDYDAFCLECDDFVTDFLYSIEALIKVGVKLIMLDDELCLSVRPGIGCFCDKHISLIEERVSESLDGKDLKKLIFGGAKNKYRNAWHTVMGDSHRRFAKRVRAFVDTLAPDVRVGFCAGYTSWDIEGVSALELTKLFAGDTKPFLRLMGAPYWSTKSRDRFKGQPLSAVIETVRSQERECRERGVEIFFEGDTFPRQTVQTPATNLECFAMALYASGGIGELGYFFDYGILPNYEQNYYKLRLYNTPIYKFIDENFGCMTCSGIKVYNRMNKILCSDLSDSPSQGEIMERHFNRGAEFLSFMGIPTTYEDEYECGIAFGEEARYIDKLPKKLILDARAAEILKEKGVDVGFTGITKIERPMYEVFGDVKLVLTKSECSAYRKMTLKENAVAESNYLLYDEQFPASYKYKNEDTEFLVLSFDSYELNHRSASAYSYSRQRQIIDFCEKIPHIPDKPGVYQIYKKSDKKCALLFINIFDDPIIDGDIILDKEYKDMKIIGASGVLCGDKINLTSTIHPYTAVAVVLSE